MGFNGSNDEDALWDAIFSVELTAVALDTTSRFSTTFTATTTSGSPILSSITSTANLQLGMVITGTGVPADSYIMSIASTTITLSKNATSSATNTMTAAFYLYDWKEKAYDTDTGASIDVDGGRAGSYALEPAVEANNQKVTVPCLAWGRYRSSPKGEQVWEFSTPAGASSTVTNNITYEGHVYFDGFTYIQNDSYFTINSGVSIGIFSPIYLSDCLIMAGPAGAGPTNPPTYSWGGGGSGGWLSGVYKIAISYVDATGAETPVSTDTTTTSAAGSPSLTVNLNNSPDPEFIYWRVYVSTPDGDTNTKTSQPKPTGTSSPTVYDIAIGTTSVVLPGPYTEGKEVPAPPADADAPWSCFLPPTTCNAVPDWEGLAGQIVIDPCAEACGNPYPRMFVNMDGDVTWLPVIGTGTLGDMIAGGTDGVAEILCGNTTTSLKVLSQVGTGVVSALPQWIIPHPMTTTGDMIYASNTATPATQARLGIGASARMLIVNSGLPSWQAMSGDATISDSGAITLATVPVAKGGTGSTSLTDTYVMVGNGTSAVTMVNPSTAGYVLTSNGAGSDPSFQAPSSPSGGITWNTVVIDYTELQTAATSKVVTIDAMGTRGVLTQLYYFVTTAFATSSGSLFPFDLGWANAADKADDDTGFGTNADDMTAASTSPEFFSLTTTLAMPTHTGGWDLTFRYSGSANLSNLTQGSVTIYYAVGNPP